MSARGRKRKPRGAKAVLTSKAVEGTLATVLRAVSLYSASDEKTFVSSDKSWPLLQAYLRKLIAASNDYNAEVAANAARALVSAHTRHYVVQVKKFFDWFLYAKPRHVNAVWEALLDLLFDRATGLYVGVAEVTTARRQLHWRAFQAMALDRKRGPAAAAWECLGSVIKISGKTLQRESAVPIKAEDHLKRPAGHLVSQLDALLK